MSQEDLAPTGRASVGHPRLIGESPAIRDVWTQIEKFAPTDVSILLTGESGSGKDLLARTIHRLSQRSHGPFIEVDCASIPESLIEAELFGHEKGAFTDAKEARKGKFELASGGTIFLDELGNLSIAVQAKLLRIVQERSFRRLGGSAVVHADVRIVSATNLDLRAAMERQAFRPDLFYRLAELHIRVPALRDRREDVPALFDHFVTKYNRVFQKAVRGPSPSTLALLERHPWPGNIRELLNVARSSTLLADDLIAPAHLPEYFQHSAGMSCEAPPERDGQSSGLVAGAMTSGAVERFGVRIPWGARDSGLDLKALHQQVRRDLDRYILASLRGAGLNKAQISRYLSLDYKVLLDKFKELGLSSGRPASGSPLAR